MSAALRTVSHEMTSTPQRHRTSRGDDRMFVAFEHFDRVRNPIDHEVDFELPDEPGLAHAIGLLRSWDREGLEFYTGLGIKSLCGVRIHVRTPMVFPTEDPDACPNCAVIVKTGHDPRPKPARPRQAPWWPCGQYLNLEDEDLSYCSKPSGHSDEHRAASGETWETGREDEYTPAPDGFV